MKYYKIKRQVVAIALVCGLPGLVHANAEDTSIQMEKWKCKWCEFDEAYGVNWNVELGLGNLSEESNYFMQNSGLSNDGSFGIANFSGQSLDEEGYFWQVKGESLASNNRALSFASGVMGSYRLDLGYKEQSRWNSRVESPFIETGSQSLNLPPQWVFGFQVEDLTLLPESLIEYKLGSKRKTASIGFEWQAQNDLPKFNLSYSKQNKKGTRSVGAAIGIDNAFDVNSSILPLSFDYDTQQVDAQLSYHIPGWQLQAGLYSSFFSDNSSRVRWQNPFSNGVDGWGEFGAAPDNHFEQIYFSVSHQYSTDTTITGHMAYGQMRQNESFSDFTINPAIGTQLLPASSLDGKVNTWTGNLKFNTRFSKSLRLNANLRVDEKDNKTITNSYDYVIADTIESLVTRTNIPYGFSKSLISSDLEYRFSNKTKIIAGFDLEQYDRTYQVRKKTEESTYRMTYKTSFSEKIDARVKLESSDRDGDARRSVGAVLSTENLLMEKFNLADRQRDHIQIDLAYYISDNFDMSFSADFGEDDYSSTSLGLLESDFENYSLDLSWLVNDSLSFYSFAGYERYKSSQSGSQNFTTADWFNDLLDTTITTGAGFEYSIWEGELSLGADVVYSESEEINDLNSEVLLLSIESLPEVNVDISSVEFYMSYQINEDTTLSSRFIHQSYKDDLISDYALAADSLVDVLLLEQLDSNQSVNYVSISIGYKF
ncbi:MAG: MtrB/PioB family decaheme-associated outer membrane protein [Kangiellaceae bacterium]|nr:MtrB/PioB family decaheme-associated outer membrane protein [Kangiellaceae bacterium]